MENVQGQKHPMEVLHCRTKTLTFCTHRYLVVIVGNISNQQNCLTRERRYDLHIQYIPRNMHMVFALLCFVVVIHWLIFPYPSGLLHWHCGNLTIALVPAKQPWWIWINTSCEFIMNDCITTTKQSTTKPCAYFLGYTAPATRWIIRIVSWIYCLAMEFGSCFNTKTVFPVQEIGVSNIYIKIIHRRTLIHTKRILFISIAHVIIIIKSEVSTLPFVIIFFRGCVPAVFVISYSVTYCIYIPGNRDFVFIITAQFMMIENSRLRFGVRVVFVCLYITPSHYHHCANLSDGTELIKCLSDLFCRVCE